MFSHCFIASSNAWHNKERHFQHINMLAQLSNQSKEMTPSQSNDLCRVQSTETIFSNQVWQNLVKVERKHVKPSLQSDPCDTLEPRANYFLMKEVGL